MSTATQAIVVVDDEKSYLDLIAQLLKEQFANPVITFSRPAEALEALPSIDAGIVVTDYYMPELTGLQLILRARGLKPGMPFIIISGHGIHLSEEDYSHVPELRAVISKPVGWRQLNEAIATHWPAARQRTPEQTLTPVLNHK